jgi:hypothetical protein
MTTCIYVENILGSGQVVKLTEDFGDYSVSRNLQPGENARLVVSPYKSVWLQELPLASAATLLPRELLTAVAPAALALRSGASTSSRRVSDGAGGRLS